MERFLQKEGDGSDGGDGGGYTASEIVLAIGMFVLMVGIGASCKLALLRKMAKSPRALRAAIVGVCCQFLFMPLVAYVLILIFRLEGYTALGVALAAAMPGGSTSNVFTMWGKGVLELSVFMTLFSTVAAFGLTPLWLLFFTTVIDGVDRTSFDFANMGITFALLAVPLCIGFGLTFVPCCKRMNIEKSLTVFAVLIFFAVIVLLCVGYPDTLSKYTTWEIVVSAGIYFPIAASLSYGLAALLKLCPSVRRTVVMEVGLQNLALGFTVGQQSVKTHSDQMKALPFPLIYAMFMYFWGFAFVPLMRAGEEERGEGSQRF